MKRDKFGRIAIVTLLATFSTYFVLNLPIVFTASQVLAQTTNERITEAYQLLQQGFKQLETRQFEAALQSCQKALIIFQETKDRKGEGLALAIIGSIYSGLENYPKAIEYYQQFLTITRETKNR